MIIAIWDILESLIFTGILWNTKAILQGKNY